MEGLENLLIVGLGGWRRCGNHGRVHHLAYTLELLFELVARIRRGVDQHASHLVVHGTLHLLGYDHQDDAQASDMEAREVRALARLGIANPYEVAA